MVKKKKKKQHEFSAKRKWNQIETKEFSKWKQNEIDKLKQINDIIIV